MLSRIVHTISTINKNIESDFRFIETNPYFLLHFDSNYATTERNFDVNHKSLESIIKQLKFRIENKDRLTKDDLKKLLTKLTTQKANAEQALEILSCCTFARLGENQTPVVENIWKELKTQNDDLKIQHYNCVLSFARDKANIELAEDIFNEMQKNGIKPDA